MDIHCWFITLRHCATSGPETRPMNFQRIIILALILLLPTGCVVIGSPSAVEGQNPGECSDDADNNDV